MKRRALLNRRALLRGMGGVAIGLPFLEAMAPRAYAATFPKRLVVFFSANGTIPETWGSGSESSLTLGPILEPLEAYKSKLLLLEGFNNQVAHTSNGDGHQNGMGCMLTGIELNPGDLFCLGDCTDGKYIGWAGGISLDQMVAKNLPDETKFKSVEFGVQVQSSTVWSHMSYLGGDEPVTAQDDPSENFDRLFGDLGADPFGLAQIKAQRKSVLDVVSGDFEKLNARLGTADKKKLDAHLTAVREIELSLDKPGAVLGGACQVPQYENPGDIYAEENFPAVGKAQMDLLAMALKCNLTHVASIQWDTAVSDIRHSWAGVPDDGHHSLSHVGDDDAGYPVAADKLTKINNWYAQQFGYLLGLLDAVEEGEGTMLDNTIVLWCNELAKGNSHSPDDMRWILAGGGGGSFKMGRYLKYDGEPHNRLLISIAQAMGLQIDTFGNPDYCTGGPMPKLTG